jgi:hypothetical protein
MQIFYNIESRFLGRLVTLSLGFFYGTIFVFGLLGLIPYSSFVPVWIQFLVFGSIVVSSFLPIIVSYKSYLLRSLYFTQVGSYLVVLMSIFRGMAGIALAISSFRQLPESLPTFILYLLELFAVYIFIQTAWHIIGRVEKDRHLISPRIWIALVLTILIVIFRISLGKFIDFSWVALFALTNTLEYYDRNPTKAKSNTVLYVGFIVFSLFWTLNIIDPYIFEKMKWGEFLNLGITILGAATGIFVDVKLFSFQRKRQRNINKDEYQKAIKESMKADGVNVYSINKTINLAIITKDYIGAHNFMKWLEARKNINSTLVEYAIIYLHCAEFENTGKCTVVKNETPDTASTITRDDEFRHYLLTIFPKWGLDSETWYYYASNPYIRRFIPQSVIEKLKPPSVFDTIWQYISRAIVIFCLFVLVIQQTSGVLISFLPSLSQGLLNWNSYRVYDARFKFVEAFTPYEFSDDFSGYYAWNIFKWVDRWTELQSEANDGLSNDNADIALNWYLLVASLNESEKSQIYYQSNFYAARMYQTKNRWADSVEYYRIALDGLEGETWRDYAVLEMAESLIENDQQEEAVAELKSIQGLEGYLNSKFYLADIYYSYSEFENVVAVLSPLKDQLGTYESLLLGYSYYRTEKYKETTEILKPLIKELEEDENKKNLIDSYIYLGRATYEAQQYFESADFFYKGLSRALMYDFEINSSALDLYLPMYFSSIEYVSEKNSSDTRVDMWLFIYHFYSGNQEMAGESLEKFFERDGRYDSEFLDWLIAEIKK